MSSSSSEIASTRVFALLRRVLDGISAARVNIMVATVALLAQHSPTPLLFLVACKPEDGEGP